MVSDTGNIFMNDKDNHIRKVTSLTTNWRPGMNGNPAKNQALSNTCLYTMIYDLLPIVNRLTRVGKGKLSIGAST